MNRGITYPVRVFPMQMDSFMWPIVMDHLEGINLISAAFEGVSQAARPNHWARPCGILSASVKVLR